jgi:hypothetical protein
MLRCSGARASLWCPNAKWTYGSARWNGHLDAFWTTGNNAIGKVGDDNALGDVVVARGDNQVNS